MAYTIEARGLTKAFGTHKVLEGLDLEIEAGEVFALLGPNGAGKTTTVRILATLLEPDEGSARVAGHDVVTQRKEVRRRISLTAQEAAVDGVLTGAENLKMMARLRRVKNPRRLTDDLLERFDLEDAADRRVETYSGGMRRRLDLAMSLISKPEVIFLDEPSTGLDPRSRLAVWEAVQALADDGATILLTTQYLEEADRLAKRIAVVNDGRIAAQGTAQELKQRVGEETLELIFADAATCEAAALRVGGRAQAATLRLPAGGPQDVRRVLDALDGLPIARLELHKPTLDEVFLALT
ncbi:daunorubicin resistance protein DrrA family ABC transporter ATP-binding protein [Solirubrobacter soli]|uniref:daunorubicin resistance protein DrrA family ABC transporter ATP-binding protein n=1 Tax=Solirubrobacter soli TaxID=363832 RepID=UPI000412C64E|nr:daunorubicin resistance protein DrrA family ABC transporter ATP-binding protein [Solirubrobacter soli]